MSSETTDHRTEQGRTRGLLRRILASPFLKDLASNRLALAGMLIIIIMVVIAVTARFTLSLNAIVETQLGTNPRTAAPTPLQYYRGEVPMAEALRFPFGTDIQGRDIFPRVMYGAWLALKFGTVTVGVSTVLGVGLGIVAAYYGDVTDNLIMRSMDVLLAFPSLLLALALVAIFPSEVSVPPLLQGVLGETFTLGMWRAVVALIMVYTPRFARVVRGAALKVLEDEYIEATIALGATDPRVLVRHVVPNTLAPITVQSTLNFGLAIIDLAALSFLGFGAEAGTPSWGLMLSNGVELGLLAGQWWWSFFPGLFLAITVLGFNLLGDGMRDALDPRMRENVK